MESIALTGSRRMSAVHHTAAYVAMEKDEKSHMTERILNLTLEIIYLLTGEKYAAVKMTCIEGLFQGMYPPMSERWERNLNAIAVPPAILERNNVEKIRDITSMLIGLLTGEVPIRCQDVTDCISKENDYLGCHKDVVMENEPPLTSPDGSSSRGSPERCPRPLYSRDSTQEHHEIPQARPLYSRDTTQEHHEIPQTRPLYSRDSTQEHHEIPQARPLYSRDSTQEHHEIPQTRPLYSRDSTQVDHKIPQARPLYSRDPTQEDHKIPHHYQGIDQINIKVEIKEEEEDDEEETYVIGGHPCKEEDGPAEVATEDGNIKRSSMGCPILPSACDTDEDKSQDSFKIHPAFHNADRSPSPPSHEEFSPNNSPSPTPNIHQELHCVAGSPAPSNPEDLYTNRSHTSSSNIYPGLDEGDISTDPSHPEEPMTAKSGSVSNIKPGLLIPYRLPDPCKPEETSSDQSQTTSPNIISSLLIGYRPPVPFNSEESSFSDAMQRAEPQEDALYPCFSRLVKMVEHQRTQGDNQLGQKPAFGDHHKKHLGKKVFPCVECEKFFAHSSDLDKHQRRHSREKPFSCSECGKSYTQKSHLVNHQRLHTGENILPCTECGRCFTLKSQFIKHMRTHTGEKPYCCSECGRCFAQKSTLDNHQTIHTGQKPFSCSQCGKHFARKSTLQKHLELHASGVIGAKPCP